MSASMETVTVSSKYQVVIPERIRRERHIRPGDKLAVIEKHGVLHFVKIEPFAASKGMFRGTKIISRDVRDHHDRF
jgi:AbrB family looped-hinge helix DNA binding protein